MARPTAATAEYSQTLEACLVCSVSPEIDKHDEVAHTSYMNKLGLRLVLFAAVLTSLVACSGDVYPPPCSQASDSLAPTCSPVPPTPVATGSWEGTLTTITGGSGTQSFMAKIDLTNSETGTYTGILNVGAETYNVSGGYNPYTSENYFALRASLDELAPALSPGLPFYGIEWYGEMTKNHWEGRWSLNAKDEQKSQAGTFTLERLP